MSASARKPGREGWYTGETWMEELGTLQTPTPTRILRTDPGAGAETD